VTERRLDRAWTDRMWGPVRKLTQSQREIGAYLVFGVLTTVVNIGVYAALTRVTHIPYLWSNAIAWAVAVAFAFVTNKLWVFESRSMHPAVVAYEAGTFLLSRLASGLLDTGMMFAMVSIAHMPDVLAKVLVNVVVVLANYVLSKLIVFRRTTA
jgi:putative flippase GtrA